MRSLPLPIRGRGHLRRLLLLLLWRGPLVMRSVTGCLGEGGSGRRRWIAVGMEIIDEDQDRGVSFCCAGT